MNEDQHSIWTEITNVLDGTATAAETRNVEKWLSESDVNQKIYATIANVGYFRNLGDLSEVKARIRQKLEYNIAALALRRKIRLYQSVAAAAVAVLLVVGGWMFMRQSTETTAFVETATANGCKSQVTLSDGTVVALNSGSYLKYPSRFNDHTREVELVGEAYFEVAKDKKHPFIVRSHDIKVRVLGTHFNVKAYADDDKIITTLLEGAVQISSDGEETAKLNQLLKPNQQLVFDKRNGKTSLRNVEAPLYASWKDNQYYFENERFAQIAHELERGYNMKIIIKNRALREETFSGTFEKKESFYRILDAMKQHRGFDYRVHQDTVSIY